MNIHLILSALPVVQAQFLDAFNELFSEVIIREHEFGDFSDRGFVAMEDKQLYKDDKTKDLWYELMYDNTIKSLVEDYYGHREIRSVADLEKFVREHPDLKVESWPMVPYKWPGDRD